MGWRRLAFLAALFPILLLATAWDVGSFLGRPRNGPVPAPAPPGVVVRLQASDGVPIAGSYWPGRRPDGPAVLLLHGINNNRDRMREQALWLHGQGYAVLAIDFRGHGESGAEERTYGWHESRDAAAALAFLRAGHPHRKVGLIGVSLGGAAALLPEAGPLPVQAMMLHAVYPDLRTAIANRLARIGSRAVGGLFEPLLSEQAWLRYGVSPDRIAPVAAIRAYPGPVLVIGGGDDSDTRPEDSRALHDAAPGPKQLWLVEGADHLAVSILWNEAYRRRVGAFLAASLGPP